MKTTFKRVISLIMVMIFLLQGTGIVQAAAYSQDAVDAAEQVSAIHPEPEVIGEMVSLREEKVKHFRMSDGSFKVYSYNYPVHYLDEANTWRDINNIPVLTSSAQGVDSYRIENGEHSAAFAVSLQDGSVLSTSYGNTAMSLSLLDPDQAQALDDAVLVTSVQEEDAAQSVQYNRNATAQLIASSQDVVPLSANADQQHGSQLPQSLSSSILYEDVFPGVDYRYTAWSYNIKEEIIVRSLQDSYRYGFFLELDNLAARENDNGSISLLNKEGMEVFYIPAPYMLDAAGEVSYAVTYQLEQVEGGVILRVEADSEWIEDESRILPVTIDPTVLTRVSSATNTASDDIYSTYVHPAYPTSSLYTSDSLYTGYSGNYLSSPYITYLYFNNIPEVPTGCIITEANLRLLLRSFSGVKCTNMPIGMYRVNEPIPEGHTAHSWIAGLTYNNKPAFEENTVMDFVSTSSALEGDYLYWDITDLAKEWYAGSGSRMVALDAVGDFNASTGYAAQGYRSTGDYVSPVMEVTYRSSYGIEPYYTYQTLSAGQAGTAYIADSTGQLKIVNNILGYASDVNPFSLNLVYNSDYFMNSDDTYLPPSEMGLNMSLGAGWTLDCIQAVSNETVGATYYLTHRDGDGTIHYYKRPYDSTDDFYDEDGLGLTMKKVGTNTYRIMDAKTNYRLFQNGILAEFSDWDDNKIYINYTDGKITSITQANDGVAEITLATFAYSGNSVTSITDAAGNVYSFQYDSGKLTSIKQNSTTIASFTYSGYQVATMKDTESGYTLNFAYDNADRVSRFHESVEGTEGAQITVEYPDKNHIKYTDTGIDRDDVSDDLSYSYLLDHAGRTINSYVTDRNNRVYGASMGTYTENTSTSRKTNHILRSAATGVVAQQLLRNTSVEQTGWTHSGTSVSTNTARTGLKSITGTSSDSAAVQYASTLSEALSAGSTYTCSAYVKTDGMVFSGKGIYLKVTDSAGNIWMGEALDYDASGIDNGWARVSVTFTAKNSGIHTIAVCREGATGTFYADDFQVELGEAPSAHNLVENGNLLSATGWDLGTGASISGGTLNIIGDGMSTTTNASQVIPVNLPYGQTYVLSGWARANAAPDTAHTHSDPAQDTCKQFGLRAVLTYASGAKEYHYIPFNTDVTDWQFISLAIIPQREETVSTIQVVCAYEQNINSAQFDNISLIREVAQQMAYDENGMLLSVTSTDQATDKDTYNGYRLLTKRETAGSGTYTYKYNDPNNSYRISSSTNGLVTESFTYNTNGNLLSTTLSGSGGKKIVTRSTYSADGNRVETVTDAAGSTVSYQYGNANSIMLGLPTAVTAPDGTVTSSAYDLYGRVTQTNVDELATLEYNYDKGNLKRIIRTANGESQEYTLEYDDFGNSKSIKVGNRTLATYEYLAGNGPLTSQSYGNGLSATYGYDILGRTKTVTYSDGLTLTYTYTGDGQLYSITAVEDEDETKYLYNYDSLGRLIYSERKDDGATVLRARQGYDDTGRLITQTWQVGNETYTEGFTYNSTQDGSLNTHTIATGDTLTYGYDELRRLSTVSGSVYDKSYTYRDITTTETTNQVAGLVYDLPTDQSFGYTYDNMGNIATYTDANGTVTYTYDALGQLTKAEGSVTYEYSYDNAGNILSANGHTYTYGDSTWADLLTAVDGHAITYDAAGNPTSYYNGTNWTFTWEHGRNLGTATNGTTSLEFTYDVDGLRTTKKVNDVLHTYYYAGGTLLRETYGNTVLDFFYAGGTPYALKHNGTLYYYITNLQGDVMSIVDEQGNVVASYEYDPYGNVITATGDLAEINPLRYRGYYFDTEMGMYYLQSRYYDPEIARFINADSYASTGQGVLGYNMFAYCNNSPVAYVDPSGHWRAIDVTNPNPMPNNSGAGSWGRNIPDYGGVDLPSCNQDSIEKLKQEIEYINERNDYLKDTYAIYRLIAGALTIGKGVAMTLAPDPTFNNEIHSAKLVAKGLYYIVKSLLEWTD